MERVARRKVEGAPAVDKSGSVLRAPHGESAAGPPASRGIRDALDPRLERHPPKRTIVVTHPASSQARAAKRAGGSEAEREERADRWPGWPSGRGLGRRHRPDFLTPSGRRRPLVPAGPVFPLGGGRPVPLLPNGEKVPEGRMRGSVTPRSKGPYPDRPGGLQRGVSFSETTAHDTLEASTAYPSGLFIEVTNASKALSCFPPSSFGTVQQMKYRLPSISMM